MSLLGRRLDRGPLRLVVEGPNFSGKTTVGERLRSLLPGASILELHDFLHVHALRALKRRPSELYKGRHWRDINESDQGALRAYLRSREASIMGILRVWSYDDIIIERLHLTAYVYDELLLGSGAGDFLVRRSAELEELNVNLLMLTADPAVLFERYQQRQSEQSVLPDKCLPKHLNDRRLFEFKAGLYEQAYTSIESARTHRIDTSRLSTGELEEEVLAVLTRIL